MQVNVAEKIFYSPPFQNRTDLLLRMEEVPSSDAPVVYFDTAHLSTRLVVAHHIHNHAQLCPLFGEPKVCRDFKSVWLAVPLMGRW